MNKKEIIRKRKPLEIYNNKSLLATGINKNISDLIWVIYMGEQNE